MVDCWHQDPDERPYLGDVEEKLMSIMAEEAATQGQTSAEGSVSIPTEEMIAGISTPRGKSSIDTVDSANRRYSNHSPITPLASEAESKARMRKSLKDVIARADVILEKATL